MMRCAFIIQLPYVLNPVITGRYGSFRKKAMNEIIDRLISRKPENLGPTLAIDEIEDFESRAKITLPDDYRLFLLNVGNGGEGPPEYGLLKLGEINKNDVPDYLNCGYGDRLSTPFEFTEPYIWDGQEEEPGYLEKTNKAEFGCLALGHDGCGMFWLLVVNGEEKGKVWQITDMGIVPCAPPLTFTQWYENWLNGNTEWWANA